MVAKQKWYKNTWKERLNLAKIHMVAKLNTIASHKGISLNLAKIHMVAKRHSCILQ